MRAKLGFIPTKVPNPPQDLRHQADIIDLLVFLAPPFVLNLMGGHFGSRFFYMILIIVKLENSIRKTTVLRVLFLSQ